jgi:hypothetical protein
MRRLRPGVEGTLIAFRNRLIEMQMDRRLIERTIDLAKETGAFGAGPLRAALDSSPLWGASRVEDTYNLLGHAPRQGSGRDRAKASAGAGRDGERSTCQLDWQFEFESGLRPRLGRSRPRGASARARAGDAECSGTLVRQPTRGR